MKKILVGTSLDPFAAGDMAVLLSSISTIKSYIPDVDITVLVYSSPETMQKIYGDSMETYNIRILTAPWWFKEGKRSLLLRGKYFFTSLLLAFLRKGFIRDYEIYIELSTDQHTTEAFGYGHFYTTLFPLFLCILSRKPFVICGVSVGPFDTKLSKLAARFVFNRARLFTVRDEISLKYLKETGINTNLYLTADPAFLLEPASPEKIEGILASKNIDKNSYPLIGISPSGNIWSWGFSSMKDPHEKRETYIETMAKVADYIVENLNARILFLPRIATQDIGIIGEIQGKMRQKHMSYLVGEGCTTNEQAGIIGRCKMFIACRMHAAIASVSSGVPTIALSYSHKFPGILTPFADGAYIIDIRAYSSPGELLDKFHDRINYILEHRDELSQKLNEKMPEVRKRAAINAELLKKALHL